MTKISVVIPSYNHAAYIGKAIQSVLNQTEKDFELIIVDDGSTDKSLEVIRRFKDPRIRLFPQNNCGAHAAINHGISLAHSPYLAILNSDDQYTPSRLQKLTEVLEKDASIGLCGSYIEVVDASDRLIGIKHGYQDLEPWPLSHLEKSFRSTKDLHAVLMTENFWSTTSNFVFRREWHGRVGAFRPLRYVHDWDFALRMSQCTGLYLQEEPLMKYRVHSSNTIRENHAAMIFEICWILAVHLPEQIQAEWFCTDDEAGQVERLLYSIHVFQMDRVLAGLLVQGVSSNLEKALALLEPDNSVRIAYIRYISSQLEEQGQEAARAAATVAEVQSPRNNPALLERVVTKIKRFLKQ